MQLKDVCWKPEWADVKVESQIHPHLPEEKADFFHAADGGSTEYEVLNWLHATIRVLKPNLVLETGGFLGFGTLALAHACKLNGFGKVVTIENNQANCVAIENMLQENNLSKFADVHNFDSIEYILKTNQVFNIGFFDSETSIRPKECEILLNKKAIKQCAVFHDTSPHRTEIFTNKLVQEKYRKEVFSLSSHPQCSGYFDSPLSRGFIALWMKPH